MQHLINEARRALNEDAEHEPAFAKMHADAGKKLGAALKRAGLKVAVLSPSWWSTPISIDVPSGSYSGAYELSVTAQHLPKPGYEFAIRILGPYRTKEPQALAPFQTWKSTFGKLVSLFGKYGKAKIAMQKKDAVQLWVDVSDDKVEKLISDAPGLMQKVAAVIAPPIVDLKG